MNPLKKLTPHLSTYNRQGWTEYLFGGDATLARELVRQCKLSARKGTTPDITPWLALCDLAEEHGRPTSLRRYVLDAVGS